MRGRPGPAKVRLRRAAGAAWRAAGGHGVTEDREDGGRTDGGRTDGDRADGDRAGEARPAAPDSAPRELDGRVALVTGASSGLGAHFAALLAGRGATVAACARRLGPMRELAERAAGAGDRIVPVELDVGEPASVAACAAAVAERLGGVDVLVNNAGVMATGPALEQGIEDFDAVLDVNLRGAWLVARAVAPLMRERGGGSIVNVASILGLRVAGNVAPYAISKAGLVQMTKALALEWARHGIRVNALAPGYVETDLNRDFFASEAGAKLVARIPQRRLGRMDELDGPLLLLAGDAGSYMTGSVLACDGGHLVSSL